VGVPSGSVGMSGMGSPMAGDIGPPGAGRGGGIGVTAVRVAAGGIDVGAGRTGVGRWGGGAGTTGGREAMGGGGGGGTNGGGVLGAGP
jgi:hypothetical protein